MNSLHHLRLRFLKLYLFQDPSTINTLLIQTPDLSIYNTLQKILHCIYVTPTKVNIQRLFLHAYPPTSFSSELVIIIFFQDGLSRYSRCQFIKGILGLLRGITKSYSTEGFMGSPASMGGAVVHSNIGLIKATGG
jgi:hypothetical protein